MNEQRIIKQFAEQLHMEFGIQKVTIYKETEKICGDTLDSTALERYMSLTCTTVFIHSNSSCLVSQIYVNSQNYIIILFSDCKTKFDGIEKDYVISELKNLKKKLGEIK